MKQLRILLLLFIFISPLRLLADEGMWLISLVQTYNYEKAKSAGLKMPADKIYNETNPSLKDAIVSFGGGCTAEFVSYEGLLFTNHHCGYDAIAGLSTVEKNYLDNGFWAKNKSEEIHAPGLTVKILLRMQEVTDSIVPVTKSMAPQDRTKKIAEIMLRLQKNADPDKKYKVEVKSFYSGNQYFLFIYQIYNDVRLVGTAPQSIGKFGGDTDNWMWPRHTGDFSVFRVYAGKDNQPAAYSADNVPYKPKYALNVSLAPLKEGDFTMIVGFPGRTDRYQTSYGLDFIQNVQNPTYIDIFSAVTDAEKMEMDKDVALRLKLSSTYASQMNTKKLFQGQLDGFARIHPVDMKRREEKEFMIWVKTLPEAEQKDYQNLMSDFESIYKQLAEITEPMFYPFFSTSLLTSMQIAGVVNTLSEPLKKKMSKDSLNNMIEETKKSIAPFRDEFVTAIDKNALVRILKSYNKKVSADKQASVMKEILAMNSNSDMAIEMYVNNMLAKSIISNPAKLDAFFAKPSSKVLDNDPLMKFYNSMLSTGMQYRTQFQQLQARQQAAAATYVGGIIKMKGIANMYPDANSTMRLTYGTVQHFVPRDAVIYDWKTTTDGIMEKYIPGDQEFDVPQELRDAINKKDFGPYGINGTLPVCFLTTNDITGGNSGSPIMDASGNWIGLAFDGNYEGTACNYVFEVPMNRTINVSINYVLFLVDKVYGASHLVKEMTFVQ